MAERVPSYSLCDSDPIQRRPNVTVLLTSPRSHVRSAFQNSRCLLSLVYSHVARFFVRLANQPKTNNPAQNPQNLSALSCGTHPCRTNFEPLF